ncbi:MAG TPA: MFS transporter [bacterium]|nr:MFS transporter [bacterium]
MGNNTNLKEYYKYNVFAFLIGFGGPTWGAFTYFFAIPVVYLTFLNASKMQIGLITAIFWAGFSIPQVWAAYASETKKIKKTFMAAVILLAGIAWIILGLYIMLTRGANTSLSIWLFLLFFAWSCSLTGMYMPANFSLLFKIIPTERLGQFLGIIFAIQFGAFVIAGPVITKIGSAFGEPMNYALMFLLTFIISVLCAIVLLTIKEPEGELVEGSQSFGAYLGKCINVIKTDRILTKFIIGKWLMSGHYVMLAFLLAYRISERGFDPMKSGWFNSFHAIGLIIGGFTITKIADIYGPKYMLLTSHILAIIYVIIAWLIPSPASWIIFAAFIFTGITQISDNVGYTNMCLFCCPTKDKSTYVAVTNVGVNIFTVPLPIILGLLMDKGILNYNSTFILVMVMMVAAIIYILTVMENPKAFIEMKAARTQEKAASQVQ